MLKTTLDRVFKDLQYNKSQSAFGRLQTSKTFRIQFGNVCDYHPENDGC